MPGRDSSRGFFSPVDVDSLAPPGAPGCPEWDGFAPAQNKPGEGWREGGVDALGFEIFGSDSCLTTEDWLSATWLVHATHE